ncbi:hypothetical protein Taro_027666, partial [Colocasia esculenta]|nr:hypothetical protein [Colocasia esculenta]
MPVSAFSNRLLRTPAAAGCSRKLRLDWAVAGPFPPTITSSDCGYPRGAEGKTAMGSDSCFVGVRPLFLDLVEVERQLDLSSVATRLRDVVPCVVNCEAYPFSFQVKESRRVLVPLLVRDRTVAGLGLRLQQKSEMADRKDWEGGGDESEESTHQLIEMLWESITEIRTRLDQQPPVHLAVAAPLVEKEAVLVPLAPPPPPPGVEGDIGYLSVTGICTGMVEAQDADRVCGYAPYVVTDDAMMEEYFIRGLRPELQDVVIPLMCRTVETAQRAAILERTVQARQSCGTYSFQLPQQPLSISKGKAPLGGASTSGFGKLGSKLKKIFQSRGGGRQQGFQQGRGFRPEFEESQQSTARQPTVPS